MNEIHFLMSCKDAAFFVAMATEICPHKSDFRRHSHCSALVSCLSAVSRHTHEDSLA